MPGLSTGDLQRRGWLSTGEDGAGDLQQCRSHTSLSVAAACQRHGWCPEGVCPSWCSAGHCESTLFDADAMIHSHNGSCIIISFRFMHAQGELARVLQPAASLLFPPVGETLSGQNWLRAHAPSVPALAWLSHGLWHLPGNGVNASALHCARRFTREVAVFHAMLHAMRVPTVVWATNPLLTVHPVISKGYFPRE